VGAEFVSLRKQLKGAISDFLDIEKMACPHTENGLVEVINALSLYREEGKALFPKIFIFDDLSTVLKILAVHDHVRVGEGPKGQSTCIDALKKCAPLAQGGWAIYILRKNASFEYGLFRGIGSVLTISIENALINNGMRDVPVIMAQQLSEKYVKVEGVSGNSILINFGATRSDVEPSTEGINRFINTIVLNVPAHIKEQTSTFYETLFSDVLRAGHGTLATVISHRKKLLPKRFHDSIVLNPPIDIPLNIQSLLSSNDIESNCRLEASASLIKGMMLSDGITIFNDAGAVVAYNTFIKHTSSGHFSQGVAGGARRRTFDFLISMIGKGLESAFMQSQDGAVLCKETSHEEQ
jgi:hypothetical protein